MKNFYCIVIVLFTMICHTNAEVRSYSGDVYSKKGNNFIYKGSIESGSKLAVKKNNCYDETGNIIIKERTEYIENTCEIVNMHIQDLRTGKEEIIIDNGNTYTVKFKKNHKSTFREKNIKKENGVIHPTVLAMYMQQNMDKILTEKTVKVSLLLPNRLCTIDFQLTRQGIVQINNEQCYNVKLEPSSLLVKQFVNPIHFYVKKNDPSVLVKYEGIIGPTDLEGNSQSGHIIFSFN
ncbi:MAG: hypothetical protein ACLFQM_09530 [Fidelibacterota bacterium]